MQTILSLNHSQLAFSGAVLPFFLFSFKPETDYGKPVILKHPPFPDASFLALVYFFFPTMCCQYPFLQETNFFFFSHSLSRFLHNLCHCLPSNTCCLTRLVPGCFVCHWACFQSAIFAELRDPQTLPRLSDCFSSNLHRPDGAAAPIWHFLKRLNAGW